MTPLSHVLLETIFRSLLRVRAFPGDQQTQTALYTITSFHAEEQRDGLLF
jgi:hypothetical protein